MPDGSARTPPSPDPAGRLGVFKQFNEVPVTWRHDLNPGAYDARDIWREYDDATGALTTDSERQSADLRRAVKSWNEFMADRSRHEALARPQDVESWCDDLLDRMEPKRAYNPYWVTVEKLHHWLMWHRDHPHNYHVLWMAAHEYPDGAARQVWDAKIARREVRTDGGRPRLIADGGEDQEPVPDLGALSRIAEEEADVQVDPLNEHADEMAHIEERTCAEHDIDLMDWYLGKAHSSAQPRTKNKYRQVYREWSNYMAEEAPGRHPSCPKERHVRGYITRLCNRHGGKWAEKKLGLLGKWFDWVMEAREFPIPATWNPFRAVSEEYEYPTDHSLATRDLSLENHRDVLADVTHERDLAWILLGLKLGMREGEVLNVQLQDIHLRDPALRDHYPELGTHHLVAEHPNAIYIPPGLKPKERGAPPVELRRFPNGDDPIVNKSRYPRVMPLDAEMRQVLTRYLLTRYDDNEPWVFLTETHHDHFRDQNRVNEIWRNHYKRHGFGEDTEAGLKGVTSHQGRHWFSDFWEDSQALSRSRLNYIRGDTPYAGYNGAAIGDYLHPAYEDIEEPYDRHMPQFLG